MYDAGFAVNEQSTVFLMPCTWMDPPSFGWAFMLAHPVKQTADGLESNIMDGARPARSNFECCPLYIDGRHSSLHCCWLIHYLVGSMWVVLGTLHPGRLVP